MNFLSKTLSLLCFEMVFLQLKFSQVLSKPINDPNYDNSHNPGGSQAEPENPNSGSEEELQSTTSAPMFIVVDVENFSEAGYLTRLDIETKCDLAEKRCWASDMVIPTCGNDGRTYLNPGVMLCAQNCDNNLEMEKHGPCAGDPPPPTKPTTTRKVYLEMTTKAPHTSSPRRLRTVGILQEIAISLGLHVHDDGGIYLADDEKYPSWWNL